MAAYPAWDDHAARLIITGLAHLEGAALPVLHALQDEFGYVDPKAVPVIAEALNLSRAEVHGTISFYHDFRTSPPPRRTTSPGSPCRPPAPGTPSFPAGPPSCAKIRS